MLRTHLCMYALGDPRLYVHSACSVSILRVAVSCLRSDSRLWYAAVLAGAGRPQWPRANCLALGGLGRQRRHGRELDRGPGWCPPPLLAVCGCLRLRAASPEATTYVGSSGRSVRSHGPGQKQREAIVPVGVRVVDFVFFAAAFSHGSPHPRLTVVLGVWCSPDPAATAVLRRGGPTCRTGNPAPTRC